MTKHLIAEFDSYAREPILRRMKDGTLVCLFLTGGPSEPRNSNVVKIARSKDDGVTWSEPEVLFAHDSRGCWSTELFCDCDTPFAIVQTYNAPSHYRELQTFRSFCDESGNNWSEPVSIPGTINGCSIRQGFRMSNGEILFPLYWQEARTRFNWELVEFKWNPDEWPFISGAGISSDDGKTFARHGYIDADCVLWEPNAIEVEPGQIIMYCRSPRGYLYRSESFDYGRTWSKAEMTDIPNADTKLTLIKVRGTILLINNFNPKCGFPNRNSLAIARSTDGKHFEKIAEVEDPSETWFYPHAYVDEAQEMLYIAYENKKQHYLKKFRFDELGL